MQGFAIFLQVYRGGYEMYRARDTPMHSRDALRNILLTALHDLMIPTLCHPSSLLSQKEQM